jgi:hypothetical protein
MLACFDLDLAVSGVCVTGELQALLEEAEKKLADLKSIKKIQASIRINATAYEMRANTILDTMAEHLQKLRELMDDLDKKD